MLSNQYKVNGSTDISHTSVSLTMQSGLNMLVAKLKRQRSALVEKDTQYVKYEQIAHSLEAAAACFVCGQCLQFSTWEGRQLVDHVTTEHAATESVCPYCLTLTPVAEIGDHQLRHFAASTALDLYPCPHCPAYLEDKTAFLNHCQESHGATRGGGLCACGCCRQSFANVAQLAGHIEESVRPLYQCEVPGCLVKSASKLAVQRHLAKRHPSQPATAIASVDYLACSSRPIALLDLPNPPAAGATCASANPTTAANQQQRPAIFSLRCPDCSFASVSWARFARHLSGSCRGRISATTEGGADVPAAAATFKVWCCSECGAQATDPDLVREHIACDHQGEDCVVISECSCVNNIDNCHISD